MAAATGDGFVQVLKEIFLPAKAEIVWPDKVKDVLRENPEATLDDLITR